MFQEVECNGHPQLLYQRGFSRVARLDTDIFNLRVQLEQRQRRMSIQATKAKEGLERTLLRANTLAASLATTRHSFANPELTPSRKPPKGLHSTTAGARRSRLLTE